MTSQNVLPRAHYQLYSSHMFKDKNHPALVLSGGGVKAAAFHIGVCIALREKGFNFAGGSPQRVTEKFQDPMTFKTYVGSSAGSVICTLLAAGYSVESITHAFTRDAEDENLPLFKNFDPSRHSHLTPLTYRDLFAVNINSGISSRLLSSVLKRRPLISGGLEVLLKTGIKVNGIFKTDNLEKYLREEAFPENSFDALGVNLYIVATQLNHSRKVIFGSFSETKTEDTIKYANYASPSQACAASAALPPAYAPYGITNQKGKMIYFFDGEIRDTMSTHVAADQGADLVISSYSIQPYHYNEEIGSLHEYGIPVIINQALYQVIEQKIESHIRNRKNIRGMIDSVNGYLKEIDLPKDQREKLLDILITKSGHRKNVDYIYIHPSPKDYEMFFADHFSLNPDILAKLVRIGFKSAMRAMRNY